MKIICTQENLRNGINSVIRIVSSSNTLPILSNVLLKTENGSLKISSTNLEMAINTNVRCKVEQEGEVTVPAKIISELVNNLPNKNITLEQKDNEVILKLDGYNTNIKTLPAEDFPLIPQIENPNSVKIKNTDLKKMIDQVIFAVSHNQTQPEISGVLFSIEGKTLKAAATDRYRLSEKTINLTEEYQYKQLIIPQKTVLELSRTISSNEGETELMFSETQICFITENTQIISRLVDGQYPDYKQIIPSDFQIKSEMSKKDMAAALKTTGIFSQNTNSVILEFSTDKQCVFLTTESSGLGKSNVEIKAEVVGGDCKLIMNYRYILESLSVMDGETLEIKINNSDSPSVFSVKGQQDYFYLVMPIKN